MQKGELLIPVALDNGEKVSLAIYGLSNKAKLFEMEDADSFGESPFQLVEASEYEYEFINSEGRSAAYQFLPQEEVIRFSKRRPNAGTIQTGIYVGTMELQVCCLTTPFCPCGKLTFEIQSQKTDYRTDYRRMLGEITEIYTELLMQQGTVVSQKFEADANNTSEVLYQKFSFIKSIVESDDFVSAVHRIIYSPLTKWTSDTAQRHITNVRKLGSSEMRQMASATRRMQMTEPKAATLRMTSLPEMLQVARKTETVDNQENQFVKHVLTSFMSFFQHIGQLKNATPRLQKEATILTGRIEDLLGNQFFKLLSQPRQFNLNSPVLQRKEGYREVLQAWLLSDLAAKLSWKGGNNVYSAGKKNVAVLYEYWAFLKLLQLIVDTFHIQTNPLSSLVSRDDDGIDLDLRQGKTTVLRGHCDVGTRRLNVSFFYNRTFSKCGDLYSAGSWTLTMRPDYTLSIWPGDDDSEHGEQAAEHKDQIVHVHFDAKYRVTQIPLTEQLDETQLTQEEDENELHIYKRGDILKMHAYKDAIRRTSGAYILYPGNVEARKIRGFHEIIPGLGAFCLNPASADEDASEIRKFLIEIRNHMMDRASERERMAYYQYDIYREDAKRQVLEKTLPEVLDGNRLLPGETYVLLGYYRSDEQLEWILTNKQYNFRAGYRNGALHLESEVVSARYILLHHGNNQPIFMKMNAKGPIVATRQELVKRGYPPTRKLDGTINEAEEKAKASDIYLMFSLEEPESEFFQYNWSTVMDILQKGHGSARPDWKSLTEIMSQLK